MIKRVPTGVSSLGVLTLALLALLLPASANANSITDPLTFPTAITADGTTQTFEGVFGTDNDVALWKFFLGEGEFQFSATTTSAAVGFDPRLSLYYSLVDGDASLFHHVVYEDPLIGPTAAVFDDVDTDAGLFDASFSLRLAGTGFYILALTQTSNNHQDAPAGTEFAGMTFEFDDDAAFRCLPGGICDNPDTGFFSVDTRLIPADSTPVPEPGTLSLMALGSLATAALRRRRKAAVTTRQ
jgi:hypothetical protein